MAHLSARSRRSCATRWSRSRTGASARIPASIRSASPAASGVSVSRAAAGAQGGSTITQQLARNIFLTNDRTFARKVREGILALALEWRFSKDQILELYLNRVYFGGGAYGIDAASRRFFGHSATELSVGEAAIIAGLVKAPSNYSPTADVEAARSRAGVVARPDGAERRDHAGRGGGRQSARRPACPQSPSAAEQQPLFHRLGAAAARHADRRDRAAARRLDDDRPRHAARRRRSRSTPMRRAARRAPWSRSTATARCGRWSAAATMSNSIYNRATQANRQPGSSFKLFVYLTALEAGYRPDTRRRGRADHDRRLEPAQRQWPLCRAGAAARRLRLFDQHRRGPPRPGGRHPLGRRHGAALRHHHAGSTPIPRWRSARRRCG